jgi:hypothetical protein
VVCQELYVKPMGFVTDGLSKKPSSRNRPTLYANNSAVRRELNIIVERNP